MIFLSLTIFFVFSISAQFKVACIGNSITSGYSNTGYSYVPILDSLLGDDYTVQNFGVSGTTLLKKGDNPYWNTYNFAQALASQADIITIKLGTNDTKTYNWDYHGSYFRNDYEALIDTLIKTSTKKPIIFPVLPVPIFTNSVSVSWGMRDSIIINHEIPIIKEIATQYRLTYIDAYTPLLLFGEYFTVDGVHPDKVAADTIAHLLFQAISDVTHTRANRISPIMKRELKRVHPVFKGNISNMFTDLDQDSRYEFAMFMLNGVMVCKALIDASPVSQSKVRHMIATTYGIKLMTVKKVP